MQVALEPSPLGVPRGDDPAPQGRELLQARELLCAKPLVPEREPCRRPQRTINRRGRNVAARGRADQGNDLTPSQDADGSDAQHDRLTLGIDESPVGQRIADAQARILECLGESIAEVSPGHAPRLLRKPGDRTPHRARAQRDDSEPDRKHEERKATGGKERGVKRSLRILGRHEQEREARHREDAPEWNRSAERDASERRADDRARSAASANPAIAIPHAIPRPNETFVNVRARSTSTNGAPVSARQSRQQ